MMRDTTCLHANENGLAERKKSMLQKRRGKVQELSFRIEGEGWDPEPTGRGWPLDGSWDSSFILTDGKAGMQEGRVIFFSGKSLKAIIQGI